MLRSGFVSPRPRALPLTQRLVVWRTGPEPSAWSVSGSNTLSKPDALGVVRQVVAAHRYVLEIAPLPDNRLMERFPGVADEIINDLAGLNRSATAGSTMLESSVPAVEVYPGAPLRAVAIEVYFPSMLDAYARLGAFQRRHAEFGRLVLTEWPSRADHDHAAILFAQGQERALAVAFDHVAAVTYTYSEGFEGFRSWALPLLREALTDLEPRRIDKVRYRYENVIPLAPENDLVLEPLFKLVLPRAAGAMDSVRNLHLYWKQTWPEGGAVDVALDSCDEAVDLGTAQLHITAQCTGGVLDQIQERVAEAHRMARGTFEALITPEYREKLRKKDGK